MPNLLFKSNVVHQGIIAKEGMIVSDQQQGLSLVAQNLIDRGLVEETDKPVTHNMGLVNAGQEPMPVSAPSGSGQAPNAERDAALKAAAKARQVAADAATANQVNDTAQQEAQVRTSPEAPSGMQPSPAEVAAAAANVN